MRLQGVLRGPGEGSVQESPELSRQIAPTNEVRGTCSGGLSSARETKAHPTRRWVE